MVQVDDEILSAVRPMISNQFGSLSDLPEELRNTISNIYYRYCLLGRDMQRGFFAPAGMERDYDKAMDEFIKEMAFLQSAVEALPQTVAALRDIAHSPKRYKIAVNVNLAWYKHRMENAFDAPIFWTRLKMFFKGDGPLEGDIPTLWRMFESDRS